MSATAAMLPLAEAEAVAARFVALIEGACVRVCIAGSVRRRAPLVGDIEIVCVPAVSPLLDLFGEPVGTVDHLAEALATAVARGIVGRRELADGATRWGPKYKALTFENTAIDLFACDADRWGWILAIRTGPATFSRRLVRPQDKRTSDGRRGLLPSHLRSVDGWLCLGGSHERIPTPEEADVFRLFALDYLEPWERR